MPKVLTSQGCREGLQLGISGSLPPAVNEIVRTVPERLKVVREQDKVSAWVARLARCASGLARSRATGRAQTWAVAPRRADRSSASSSCCIGHPPLEAGATRAVDPEQEAGPG